MDWIAGIIFFLFGFALWAAIGHAIWLVVAAAGKAIFGGARDSDYFPCPSCREPKGVWRGRCIYCGRAPAVTTAPQSPPPNTLTAEIQGTLKQLDRLWRRGLISDNEHARLQLACQRDLDRLTGKSPVPVPPVAQPTPE